MHLQQLSESCWFYVWINFMLSFAKVLDQIEFMQPNNRKTEKNRCNPTQKTKFMGLIYKILGGFNVRKSIQKFRFPTRKNMQP